MSQTIETVFDAALALPPGNRAELAERLLDSLSDAEQEEIDQAWAEEAKRRMQAYEQGTMRGIPLEEFLESLRSRKTR